MTATRPGVLLVVLLWAGLAGAARADASGAYAFAPAPAWLATQPLPAAAEVAPAAGGTRYLLLDDQVDTTGRQPVAYRRVAYRLDQARSLAEGGRIDIGFQPDYQHVLLHAIHVWRAGRRSDRRAVARIQELRREEDLDDGILDGEHTLSITIPDLRVGDVVDYAYSVVGNNPVFGAGYYDVYTARFSTALAYRRVRARFPADAPLHWRAPSGYVRATSADGDARIVEFVGRRLPRVAEEADVPGSFDPYGRIELSTAAEWSDIVRWAAPMYQPRLRDRALANALVRELRLDDPDKRAALTRAIAFVEGQIRYTALDMGKNSHEPNPPETVVARRFGDCKDKSLLLSALLREAGIEAEPALVDTEGRRSLAGRQPSAVVFDHVVVRAHLDGSTLWIDPTRDPESGPLEDRSPLPFELALPICDGCTGLVRIPEARPRLPMVDVGQRVDLKGTASGYRADFVVVSDYRNEKADSIRDDFAGGEEELGKTYLHYMRKYYDGLRSSALPSLRERGEGSAGNVRTTERYALRWDKADGGGFDVVLFQLRDYVPDLDLEARRMPLALSGPRFARHTVHVHLADGWAIPAETAVVANAYFSFRRTVRVAGDALQIVGEWRRLANQVPASDYPAVRDDVDKVRRLLEYNVDIAPAQADAPVADFAASLPWRAIALAAIALCVFLATCLAEARRRLRDMARSAAHPS